jgi:hypothetical protein
VSVLSVSDFDALVLDVLAPTDTIHSSCKQGLSPDSFEPPKAAVVMRLSGSHMERQSASRLSWKGVG